MGDKHLIKLSAIVAFFQDEAGLLVRGENALESGHVMGCTFDADLRILKGSVHASMRVRKYEVQIDFTGDWSIKEGSCTCPRGQYQCHHMAALLLAGHYNVSITDVSCSWNPKLQDTDEVKKISDLYPVPRAHRTTKRNLSVEEIEAFREKLSVFDGAVGFTWLLSKEPPPEEQLVLQIEDVIFAGEYLDSKDKDKYFVEKLKLTQQTIKNVADSTIGQSKNEAWLSIRKNRLTASNFSVVLAACHRGRFPLSLFKRLAGTYDLEHIKAIQWGRQHEKDAIKAFEDAKGIQVCPTGFWLHECGYLGASPDGLVGTDAIVEVKCPYKYREVSLMENIKQNRDYIIVCDATGTVQLNKRHEYFYQIQGQLALTNRSLCHLVIWTPQEVVIIDVHAESFSDQIQTLQEFYLKQYVPFLLGQKHQADVPTL